MHSPTKLILLHFMDSQSSTLFVFSFSLNKLFCSHFLPIFSFAMENSQSLKGKLELKRSFPSKIRHGTKEKSPMEEVKLAAIAISLNVRLRSSDMPICMQEHALRCSRQLLDSAHKTRPNLTHLARAIKKEFDSAYGPAWHCVIGTSFGSFVTHSAGGFVYFSIDSLSILLFKTEVELVTEEKEGQRL
ncbi:Dynein light chain type 1 family protein [Theobroma cacao]|uniref:Dynein light chain type 1 family protein n=1 Tax=Theobroma cacao TaxID=3641 RepID=A0A061F7T5_THECC|nr:Dynein light chain type 1 family protein [Theobroma cacao]